MTEKRLTRSQLFSMVWERPMTHIGTELGISANGLKKICLKHDIPRPPAGYFMMSATRRPTTPSLPDPADDPIIAITATEKLASEVIDTSDLILPERYDPNIAKEIDDYVRHMKKDASPDERGILHAMEHAPEGLLRVSPSQLVWSADRMKSLLSILKANGAVIEFRPEKHWRYEHPSPVAYAIYGKGITTLRVEESSTRRLRPLTSAEAKDKKRHDEKGWSYYTRNQWIYTPSGKPQLLFGYRNRRRLAEDIAPLAKLILDEVKRLNEVAIQNEIDRRHEKAKALQKLRPFRRQLWRKRQMKKIAHEAERWERAERLRRYIRRVEELGQRPEDTEWIQLAKRLIDRICPIQSGQYAVRESLPKYAEVSALWNQLHEDDY